MTARNQTATRPGGRPLSRQRHAEDRVGPPVDPDAWRSTVRLLLDCPGIEARERMWLHKVAGWRKLGRAEESWLATLAAQHSGEAGAAFEPEN